MPRSSTIQTGGESSHSTSYNSEEEDSSSQQEGDEEGDCYRELDPSDSASSRSRSGRDAPRRHRLSRHDSQFTPVQSPAPIPPSVDTPDDFGGHYGVPYQSMPTHRGGGGGGGGSAGGYYGPGGRGPPHPYPQNHANHYMLAYPGGNQMVPYNYGPNPFTPMSNNSSGASYFGEPRHMYEMMPSYQSGFYGAPQYGMPTTHMQHLHLSSPPPPTEAPAKPASPAPPTEPPVDIAEIKRQAHEDAMKAQADMQKALDEQRARDAQIRKDTEESILKRLEETKRQQEEAQKEIARAKAEADRAAVERIQAERKADEEKSRQEAENVRRAEENAIRNYELKVKAAEEQRKRDEEERVRIEEHAKAQFQRMLNEQAEANARAEKKAAEEAERLKLIQEEAKRKADADALAKIEAEKEAEKKAAEAEAAAKKEHEALKKRIQDETKAKLEETAKKSEKGPIKFKDAVGRKFSFPFNICNTWQGMEELIKQAFLHVDVIGPHVQEGHYDLIGPNGDIILPTVWEKVIQPDWSISMTMWPVEKMPPLGPKMPPGPRGVRGGGGIPPPPPMGVGGRPGMVGEMGPPPDWHRHRHAHIPNVEVVDNHGAPKTRKPSSKKNNTRMLHFFTGKPAKKKSSKK